MKAFRTGHYFLALFFTGFLTVRGSGRIRNEGKYSLCGRTISTVPFLCSGSSCAFALLLELSTESVEQTKNVLCMRFVFNWDFFRILS